MTAIVCLAPVIDCQTSLTLCIRRNVGTYRSSKQKKKNLLVRGIAITNGLLCLPQ